jgi:hypothetical protein
MAYEYTTYQRGRSLGFIRELGVVVQPVRGPELR